MRGLELHFALGTESDAVSGCRINEAHFFHMGVVSVLLGHDVGNVFLGHAGGETANLCVVAEILIVLARAHSVIFYLFHSGGKGELVTESRKPDGLRMNLGLNGNVKLGIAVIQTVSHFVVKERTSGYAGETACADKLDAVFGLFPGEGITFIEEAVHVPAA